MRKCKCRWMTAVALMLTLAGLAAARADLIDWGGGDCRGIASGDKTYCKTDNCKAIASGDATYCKTENCKGIVKRDKTYCR